MKYIINESSRHKLINFYLDSINIQEVQKDYREMVVIGDDGDNNGIFHYEYSEHELSIDPFIITMASGMFNMDRGQAMEGIAMWFEEKFDVTVYDVREWDW